MYAETREAFECKERKKIFFSAVKRLTANDLVHKDSTHKRKKWTKNTKKNQKIFANIHVTRFLCMNKRCVANLK